MNIKHNIKGFIFGRDHDHSADERSNEVQSPRLGDVRQLVSSAARFTDWRRSGDVPKSSQMERTSRNSRLLAN
jgi:hypothetical protein